MVIGRDRRSSLSRMRTPQEPARHASDRVGGVRPSGRCQTRLEGAQLAAMWDTLLVFPGLPRMGIRLRAGGHPTAVPLGPAVPLEFSQPMAEQAELVAFWVG
jgi:hypothetical protein